MSNMHDQPEGHTKCCSFTCQGKLTKRMAIIRHLNYEFVLQSFVSAEAAQDHDQHCITQVPHFYLSPHVYNQRE